MSFRLPARLATGLSMFATVVMAQATPVISEPHTAVTDQTEASQTETSQTETRSKTFSAEDRKTLIGYLKANDRGINEMRGKTGWPVDKVHCDSKSCQKEKQDTSLTNIALDMLYLLELIQNAPPEMRNGVDARRAALEAAVESLSKVAFHKDPSHKDPSDDSGVEKGLFYTWYDVDTGNVANWDVSAIDNFHIALALWTIVNRLPATDPLAIKSKAMLDRLDFSVYWDAEKKLLGGNLKHFPKTEDKPETWKLEAYRFKHFGAETRSLYFAGSAMGLFKKVGKLPIEDVLKNQNVEVAEVNGRKLLRTWDGSAFQLFLPQLLLDESHYWAGGKRLFTNQVDRMLEVGKKYPGGIPAGHSASEMISLKDPTRTEYSGKLGDVATVALTNRDLNKDDYRELWDSVVTPHAVFLGTEFNKSEVIERMRNAEKLGQESSRALFDLHRGWKDGVMVSGPQKGKVVDAQLALDQLMTQLALLKALSPDGNSLSSRALKSKGEIKKDLHYYYDMVDLKTQDPLALK